MSPRHDRVHVVVTELEGPSVAQGPVEIVERKGRGHPDSLCDAAAEALSVALCREYLARTGRIQHHNVDKAVLCAGASQPRFGGGRVTRPMRMTHVGRATLELAGRRLDVEALARASTARAFAAAVRHLDPDSHLEVETRISPTSRELAALFAAGEETPLANDTSMGCGFAPLSETERLVLAVERHLADAGTLARHPYLGEDTKVLAVRVRDRIELTVAAAFVARHVPSLQAYLACKEALTGDILARGREACGKLARVAVNAADRPSHGDVYLTVTGTSAEAGDDGQVGRGNRANGLITPFRPMTLEALAGKNPVSHVGKLYNAWAHRIVARLADDLGLEEVVCQLASRIGAPITEPQVVLLGVRGLPAAQRTAIAERVRAELAGLPSLWREIVDGACRLF